MSNLEAQLLASERARDVVTEERDEALREVANLKRVHDDCDSCGECCAWNAARGVGDVECPHCHAVAMEIERDRAHDYLRALASGGCVKAPGIGPCSCCRAVAGIIRDTHPDLFDKEGDDHDQS